MTRHSSMYQSAHALARRDPTCTQRDCVALRRNNNRCGYAHDAAARGEWVAERRSARRALAQREAALLGDPHAAGGKASSTHRASLFVD